MALPASESTRMSPNKIVKPMVHMVLGPRVPLARACGVGAVGVNGGLWPGGGGGAGWEVTGTPAAWGGGGLVFGKGAGGIVALYLGGGEGGTGARLGLASP